MHQSASWHGISTRLFDSRTQTRVANRATMPPLRTTMQRFCPDALKSLAARIAASVGVPASDAEILADSLISADLSGASTHGPSRLAIYIQRIQKNLIDPAATLTIDRERPSTL